MTHFNAINNTSHNTDNCMYRNLYFSSTKLLNASTHIFTKLAVCFTHKNCDGGEHDFHSLILSTCYKETKISRELKFGIFTYILQYLQFCRISLTSEKNWFKNYTCVCRICYEQPIHLATLSVTLCIL
jgi:hypothetical protein